MRKIFKVREIFPRCHHLVFETRDEMARTVLRFQEYYESPKFKGQIFTLKEYKEWYRSAGGRKNKTGIKGKFTYYSDWSGFNFPSFVLNPFYNKEFKNITEREKALLDIFKNMQGQVFYIIATSKESNPTAIDHELTHALFYLSEKYRNRVTDFIKRRYRVFGPLRAWLKENGYAKFVETDEINAYIASDFYFLSTSDEVYLSPDMEAESVYLKKLRDEELELWKKRNSQRSWINKLKMLSQKLVLRKQN